MRDVEEFFEGFQVAAQSQVQDRQAVKYLGEMIIALKSIEARLANIEGALRELNVNSNVSDAIEKIESPPSSKEPSQNTIIEETMLSFEV